MVSYSQAGVGDDDTSIRKDGCSSIMSGGVFTDVMCAHSKSSAMYQASASSM